MPGPAPHLWLHHLQDEADAAFLYRRLAEVEPDQAKLKVFKELAEVEDRHVATWRRLLAEHGHEVGIPAPSLRARSMAWLARRFGPKLLLPMLLEEEGREVKGYLQMYRDAPDGAAAPTALTLARESKGHADSLAGLVEGRSGEPWHKTGAGGFLRNVVYGFNDGLTANFGLVAGMVGAQTALGGPHTILVAGLAGMVADALSMGASGYLAAKSEREVFEHEIAMEREEIRLMPELELEELSLIYQAKGIPADQAGQLATAVMADPERALGEKVREELKIGEATSTPMREGWVTGIATAFGAFIPVFPLLLSSGRWAIWTSFAVAMLSHFGVGAARSFFTGRSVFRSGLDMFVVGLGVALVGYLVGDWIVKVI